MFSRLGHGHSGLAGFLLALSLTGHLLWLCSAALLLGLVLGRSWGFWSRFAADMRARHLGSAVLPRSKVAR